jgi:hypothetical protein
MLKTLDEMEREDPDVFKNPPVTPEEEARNQKRWEAQRIADESLPDEPEEEEEEEDEEEEDEEEE